MNANQIKSSAIENSTNSRATTTSGATSAEGQQAQQRLWVKEQEVSALKVQNRHLIAKLEDAEKSAEPNKINTQKIASEIQNQLRPLIGDIEKSTTRRYHHDSPSCGIDFRNTPRIRAIVRHTTCNR